MEPTRDEVYVALSHAGLSAAQLNACRILERSRFAPDAPYATELPSRKVASWCRVGEGYARELLDDLVELDVFELAIEGAGRRAHAFRFRPIASWVPFRADRLLLELVQSRVKRFDVSRGTGRFPGVVQDSRPAQGFVVQDSSLAQPLGSARPRSSANDPFGQDSSRAQSGDGGAGTPISSLGSALHSHSEGRAGPVLAVIRARTRIFGEPLAAAVAICDELLDVEAAAGELERSTIVTAQLFVAELEAIAGRQRHAPKPASPPPVFEPDDYGDAVRPDFSAARARMRETADVEATS